MSKTRLQMVALLEPAVEALGYELVDLEVNLSGRRSFLRLFIDRLSAVLDVDDPLRRDCALEVSSPGLDRKLIKPAHFDRFAGRAVEGRFQEMKDGRRRFAGTLVGRSGTNVTIRVENTDLTVPIGDLEVIRLKPEY
jgi:ribosome maturation factor RimP